MQLFLWFYIHAYDYGSTSLYNLAVSDQGNSDETDIHQATELQGKFNIMLRTYIHENALKRTILQQMTEILVSYI